MQQDVLGNIIKQKRTKQKNPCNVYIVSSVVYLQAHLGGIKYVAPILLMTKLTYLHIKHGLLYITYLMNDTAERRTSHKALFSS